MHLDSICHCLVVGRRIVRRSARHERALARVVVLVHQVVSRSKRHQVCVVGGGGDGDGARAPNVGVAQLVSQLLELVSVEVVVIPEDVIVAGPRRALDT